MFDVAGALTCAGQRGLIWADPCCAKVNPAQRVGSVADRLERLRTVAKELTDWQNTFPELHYLLVLVV